MDLHSTSYSDDYPSCAGTDARLAISCDDFDADEISTRLGLAPTRLLKAGDVVANRIGRCLAVETSTWFLSSEGEVESRDLRRHLDWLLDRIEPSADELRALQQVQRLEMRVDCVWWSEDGHGGPTLSPIQMARLAALGLDCCLDINFFETTFE